MITTHAAGPPAPTTHKKTPHSPRSRIHQIKLATIIHDLGYDRILPELMGKRRDFRVEDEVFGDAAAVADAADIDAVDDCC